MDNERLKFLDEVKDFETDYEDDSEDTDASN